MQLIKKIGADMDDNSQTSTTVSKKSKKSGNWFSKHKVLTALLAIILLIIIVQATKSPSTTPISTTNSASKTSTSTKVSTTTPSTKSTTSTTTSKVATRKVTGTAVTLGAGTFTGGTDVAVGLYNVTTTGGQSGNFIVSGTDSYDEVLGVSDGFGVPEIRAQISKGDSIQLSGLSTVIFTPVTTPFSTTYTTTDLFTGTFTVGQDIGAGRYVATPAAGQSGNFIVTGADNVDEILGVSDGIGVPSVTTNLTNGDVIEISGITSVTLTPVSK